VNRPAAAPASPAALLLALSITACAATSVSPSPSEPARPVDSPAPSVGALPSAPPAEGPVTLLIDTDVAPDDLLAITFLVSATDVTISAITVSGTGEAHCASGVDVVLRLLERLDAPEVPVACGREEPLAGDHTFPSTWREWADAGSGLDLPTTDREPADLTAIELMAATFAEHDGLTVLTLGPLTNLADAILSRPELVDQIGSVYVMGGAVDVPGNIAGSDPAAPDNEVAEWNVYVDPLAAATVVESGLTVRLVSLDGTNQVPVTEALGRQVMAASEASDALGIRLVVELGAANPFMSSGSYYLWDPLAATLAARYPTGTFSPLRIEVETAEGPTSGATMRADGDPNVEYLDEADAPAAEATLVGVWSAD
jgi:pyrimidine-specific ribonucleoside hydrolase